MKKIICFLLAFCIGIVSCKKDTKTCTPYNTAVPSGGVLILNQGNFGSGNASITLYDPTTKLTTANVFAGANNCLALGNVGQSMLVHDGKGYIVVNNSGKIEVVNMSNFRVLGTITGLGSPRYILPVATDAAYVTDYYSGKINIVDLDDYNITGSITLDSAGGETEQMVFANNLAYVLNIHNYDSSWVEIIDPVTNTKTNSIALNLRTAGGIVKDTFGKLWVLCSPYDSTHPSGLVKIDLASNAIDTAFAYPLGKSGLSQLTISPDGKTLYFLGTDGIYKMQATDNQLPAAPFIQAGTRYFYGLAIDNNGQKIYAGDASSFTSNDKAYSFNLTTGTLVDTIQAGIAPCFFIFK